jgi:WD40 repeat protein
MMNAGNRYIRCAFMFVVIAGFAVVARPSSVVAQPNEPSREVLTFTEHHGRVRGVAFSPDGKRIAAVALHGRTLKVWDIYGVAYRPDGKQLAAASSDGVVRVWNLTPDP